MSLSGLLSLLNPIGTAQAAEELPEDASRRPDEAAEPAELQPGEVMQLERFNAAWETLKQIDPNSRAFEFLRVPGALPTEAETAQLEGAVRDAYVERVCTLLRPNGKPIGQLGTSDRTRVMSGGLAAAQQDYDYLSVGGTPMPFAKG